MSDVVIAFFVPTIVFLVCFFSGIQLLSLGIMGEYVGRIYDEVKGRPLYLVRSRLNIADTETPTPPLPPVAAERSHFGESAPVTAETVPFDD